MLKEQRFGSLVLITGPVLTSRSQVWLAQVLAVLSQTPRCNRLHCPMTRSFRFNQPLSQFLSSTHCIKSSKTNKFSSQINSAQPNKQKTYRSQQNKQNSAQTKKTKSTNTIFFILCLHTYTLFQCCAQTMLRCPLFPLSLRRQKCHKCSHPLGVRLFLIKKQAVRLVRVFLFKMFLFESFF